MPVALLAFAARFLPAMVAVGLALFALGQHDIITRLTAQLEADKAQLTQCTATVDAVAAHSHTIAAQAAQAVAAATRARQAAQKAAQDRAALPIAATCDAAIVELAQALGAP